MKLNMPVIIGGEKVISLSLLLSRTRNNIFADYQQRFNKYFINYTFGGHCSLLAIIDDLNLNKKKDFILLPSYLCNSIVKAFDIRLVKYKFYKVDSELIPEFSHIEEIITDDVRAILFIDYMGRNAIMSDASRLDNIKRKGIKIIQDSVQTIDISENDIYGDYVFNSFRKYLPFEGSLLLSKTELKISYSKGTNFRFLLHKRIGQIQRSFYLRFGILNPQIFLRHFLKAEEYYLTSGIFKFRSITRFLIRKIKLQELVEDHCKYYQILLAKYPDLTLKSLYRNDFRPFGFLLVSLRRNGMRDILQAKGIFCPVHWTLPEMVNRVEFMDSINLSNSVLTIPLSSIKEQNINYLCEVINDIIQS
jgi:hypothetical protein